jgi:hypothetical protein
MLPAVPAAMIRTWQDGLRFVYGRPVDYYESTAPTVARPLRARVKFLTAAELANSIEQYPIRVTVDARDFAAREPEKGDTVTIAGARRGVMSVQPVHVGATVIAFALGVQG